MKKQSGDTKQGPQGLQAHGLLARSTKQIDALITSKGVPVFKLTWKLPVAAVPSDTVLATLRHTLPAAQLPAAVEDPTSRDTPAGNSTD